MAIRHIHVHAGKSTRDASLSSKSTAELKKMLGDPNENNVRSALEELVRRGVMTRKQAAEHGESMPE